MKNQKGQVILILILVITVALVIGLSITQKSLLDVSTSTKVEQSAKAFSAAEAGIEKALQADSIIGTTPVGENATLQGVQRDTVPASGQALEYPPIAKEELAQVWLADPTSSTFPNCDPGKICYSGSSLDVYWGNVGVTGADKPAIEITVVYQDSFGAYNSKRYFYDQDAAIRNNGFTSSITSCPSGAITTSLSPTAKTFFCKQTLDVSSSSLPNLSKLILLRARLLYTSISQAFAIRPITGSLPVQGRLFTATGISGETQRKVQVFKLDKVVPPYFDYAIFSAGEINKSSP